MEIFRTGDCLHLVSGVIRSLFKIQDTALAVFHPLNGRKLLCLFPTSLDNPPHL